VKKHGWTNRSQFAILRTKIPDIADETSGVITLEWFVRLRYGLCLVRFSGGMYGRERREPAVFGGLADKKKSKGESVTICNN